MVIQLSELMRTLQCIAIDVHENVSTYFNLAVPKFRLRLFLKSTTHQHGE